MFEKNILLYELNGDPGCCPVCGEKLIAKIIKSPSRRNVDICCRKCGKSEFYSGTFKDNNELHD